MTDQPRQLAGRPSGGQFAAAERPEASVELTDGTSARAARAAAIQAFLDDEWGNEAAMDRDSDFDGRPPATWGSALDSLDQMPDHVLDSILDGSGETTDQLRRGFRARAEREGLTSELPRVAMRESSFEHLLADVAQAPAQRYAGLRVDDADIVNAPAADYAEVGDEGIAYGIEDHPALLLAVVAGPRRDDEEWSSWYERGVDIEPDFAERAAAFIHDTYGAELLTGSGELGEERMTVEFWVPFEDGGGAGSSMDYMGDRVESETKLNSYDRDAELGAPLANGFAAHLGYAWNGVSGRFERPAVAA